MPDARRGGDGRRCFRTAAAPAQALSTPLWHLETRARLPRGVSASCRDARAGRAALWGRGPRHHRPRRPQSFSAGMLRGHAPRAGARTTEDAGSRPKEGEEGPRGPETRIHMPALPLPSSVTLPEGKPTENPVFRTLREGAGSLSPNVVGRRNTLVETVWNRAQAPRTVVTVK